MALDWGDIGPDPMDDDDDEIWHDLTVFLVIGALAAVGLAYLFK